MIRVVLDAELRKKLHKLTEPLELCDESGQILAHVEPFVDLSKYEPWVPEFDEEELRRREQSDKWYTTEQVLAHLKSLEDK